MTTPTMVLLLSGGIDSPIAGYLMGQQGVKLVAISGFVNQKGHDEHIKKIQKILSRLGSSLNQKIDLYTFDQRYVLEKFANSKSPKLTCVLCKRMMLRIAERLCGDVKSSAIIMGDSLGQVASQTLQNINVIEQAVQTPIVRPLIGFDKVEIIRIAEAIGTFEPSNIKSPGCVYTPPRPVTKADLEEIISLEDALGIAKLTDKLASSIKKVSR